MGILPVGDPTTLSSTKCPGYAQQITGIMDEMYERILLEIDKKVRVCVFSIFQCLLVSIRPLLIEELVDIFAIRTVTETIPVGWRPEDAEEFILSACSTLVTIVNVNDNKFIQFSHFSVKEYLTLYRIVDSEHISHCYIASKPAHAFLASACIDTPLLVDDQIDETKIKNFPLASYAARHWVDHAQFEDVSSYIQDAMECLFDKDKPHFAAWIWLYDIDNPSTEFTAHPKVPDAVPLYYAAGFMPCFVVSVALQSSSSMHILKMSTPREVDAGLHYMRLRPRER